jgi:hypothetical protein
VVVRSTCAGPLIWVSPPPDVVGDISPPAAVGVAAGNSLVAGDSPFELHAPSASAATPIVNQRFIAARRYGVMYPKTSTTTWVAPA